MIDHIYLPVSDLERSSEFYKKMLEPLGIDMPYKFDQVPQRGFAINQSALERDACSVDCVKGKPSSGYARSAGGRAQTR